MGGRKQRSYIEKHEVSSRKISTEAVFLIVGIAPKQRRDVATADIPVSFMQTDFNEDKILIRFDGRMAELLAMIGPKLYSPNFIVEKRNPVLYRIKKGFVWLDKGFPVVLGPESSRPQVVGPQTEPV